MTLRGCRRSRPGGRVNPGDGTAANPTPEASSVPSVPLPDPTGRANSASIMIDAKYWSGFTSSAAGEPKRTRRSRKSPLLPSLFMCHAAPEGAVAKCARTYLPATMPATAVAVYTTPIVPLSLRRISMLPAPVPACATSAITSAARGAEGGGNPPPAPGVPKMHST